MTEVQNCDHDMSTNTEGAIKKGQSRETGNIGHTRRRKTMQKTQHNMCWTSLCASKHTHRKQVMIATVNVWKPWFGNHDRNQKLWNIVSTEINILYMQVLMECCYIIKFTKRKFKASFFVVKFRS